MKAQQYYLKSASVLTKHIDRYFLYIEGKCPTEQKASKTKAKIASEQKILDGEPATISGMALFLGFASKQEFEAYEESGKHAHILKRARLRIEAAYEARLYQTPTGVIFALKTMGWNDKPTVSKPNDKTDNTLKVEIVNSGPLPAGSEKEVTF